ncbi:MAG: hypothetical protein KAG66_23505, partial [Methylococcales bacterium]|nr:hypothetical protein [Methylococcales bacterium]
EGDFPAHVINLHHYSNDAGGQGTKQPTVGISPEADHLRERFARIVEYVHSNFDGKEVWVSEFGYDTHPKSIQRAPAIGSFSAGEVQAQWIIRSYLALAASGVDRAQLYMLRDVNAGNHVKYNSSGLTNEKSNKHQEKTSWHYVATITDALAGTYFQKEIPSGNDLVQIYRFASDNNQRTVDVIWCASSEQAEVKGFQVSAPERSSTCQLIRLHAGKERGQKAELPITEGKVRIDVSEQPLFLDYGRE